ncbi:Ig-like domain-containing protein [Pediococcus acidilactici]
MNKNPKNHKGVVDSKVSNFKMYKVNKHWVFASALMLSMLGAGMMQTDTAAHADSTNEPQVEMMQKSAQKSAEVKADQPAAPVEKAATAASNAAKDAQKADKASSAAPTSNASSAAAKPAADSKAAESNDSSAAQPAAKDSDAKSDADKKVDAPTDQIDTTDVTAGEDGQDLKDDAAAKAAGDVKDNSENKDVNNKKSVDKEKDAKDNNSVGDSPLGDGDLTINGSAVDGLTRNSDGTYSGDLDFHFDASSVDVALFADSNTVIQIPPELRDLFNKINESGNWTRYFNGRGRFKVYIIVVPYVINWELSNSDFSFDGSNLILRNARIAAGAGRRELTIDFNFDLGKAVNDFKADIPDSSNYYHFKSALVDANSIIDWPIIGSAAGEASLSTNQLMPHPDAVDTPTINSIVEGDKTISGKGIPGATVNVSFADGTSIGSTIVDSNGNWTISTGHVDLKGGEVISANQTVDGVTSPNTYQTVESKEDVTAPVINDITEGDKTITGKGIPGATVNVTFADGTFIGTATVDADGNWSVSTAHISLKAGDELTATQTINGITSKEGNTTVKAKVVVNAPDINKVTAGDRTISGTGKPGATVNVTLDDGTVIGTATVDADGNWTVNVPGAINLKEGNVVTATQIFDGVTSEKSSRPVDPKPVVEAPHINKITEGDPVITGTGIPGAEVTVTLADGTVIGTATVDKDGNWSVNVGDVELQSGKVVNAVQTVNGVTSKQDSRVVDPKREIDAPVIGHVKEGDRTIRGTGKPGATVDVTLDDGTVIGSATVNDEGTWSVNVPDGIELKEGNIINATQTFDGVTSEKGQRTVDPRGDVKAPVINPITEGDSEITGTGKPGATVMVSFDDGTVIGTTTVDENGKWSVDVPAGVTLTAGDQVVATQTFDGVTSEQSNRKVDPQQQIDPPNINNVPSDASSITGKGVPGATVTVTLADGTVIGTAVVDENGKWSVDVPAEITFNVGDEIDPTQTLDGVTSDVSHTNVVPKAPSITPPEAGAKVIQGVGDPGATINVYAADGTLIGTTTVDDFGS